MNAEKPDWTFVGVGGSGDRSITGLAAGLYSLRAVPDAGCERMLQLAEVTKEDILYDLGSGDGRIVIAAAKKFGVRAVGVDLNPTLVEQARRKAAEEGVSHLVEFRAADGLTVDISQATVVTLYMFKWFNNQMRPKLQLLKPGSRVVAHDFDIDDWKPTKIEFVNPADDPSSELTEPRTLYLWKVDPQSPAL